MKRSPFDATIVPLPRDDEPQLPLLKPTWEERWKQIQPVLDKLEQYNLKPAKSVSEKTPHHKFDRREVKTTLAFYFTLPLKDDRLQQDAGNKREKIIRLIEALLRENPPEWVRKPLQEWRADLRTPLIRERQFTKQYGGKQCEACKNAVTRLTTYLWECLPLRVNLKQDEVYDYVGKLLRPFTSPCVVCGKMHALTDSRRVRAWDEFKGTWEERAERVKASEKNFHTEIAKRYPSRH
jgi:hypothetical protein